MRGKVTNQAPGGGAETPFRVSCTINIPGDGTVSINEGAVGIAPGSSAVAIVPDPTGNAPNCLQLDFLSSFPTAEFAFLGTVSGYASSYQWGSALEVPPVYLTRTPSRIVFFVSTAGGGFLDFTTCEVNTNPFGAPALLNIICG